MATLHRGLEVEGTVSLWRAWLAGRAVWGSPGDLTDVVALGACLYVRDACLNSACFAPDMTRRETDRAEDWDEEDLGKPRTDAEYRARAVRSTAGLQRKGTLHIQAQLTDFGQLYSAIITRQVLDRC